MSDRLGQDPVLSTLKVISGEASGVVLAGMGLGVAFAGEALGGVDLGVDFALVLMGIAPFEDCGGFMKGALAGMTEYRYVPGIGVFMNQRDMNLIHIRWLKSRKPKCREVAVERECTLFKWYAM